MSAPYKPEEDPCFLLFKRAMETASPKRTEGHSLRLSVRKGDVEISFETSPPSSSGFSRGPAAGKAPFDKAKAQAVVSEYPDFLTLEEKDGKVAVIRKKYMGDEWRAVNEKLQAAGLHYSKEVARWIQ